MISKETLRQIVAQQKSQPVQPAIENTVRREILDEIVKQFGDDRIIILTGIRRSGKSTLLRQIMKEKAGYCYVNFEDERFLDFRAQDFEQLNEILIEAYGNPRIYFFDEIQNVERFEAFVRRLQDQGKKVVMTGSNATLLSKELGTRLTGRYISFEVYPFSFSEYMAFRGVAPEKDWFYKAEKKVMLLKLFGDYLNDGGFPEYLKNKDVGYIRTIYDNILYRDIISRYSIRRQRVIKELVNFLAANVSSKFTYNSLKNTLGLSNAITVKEYISYLSNSYMFFELQKFDFSVKRQLNMPKKIYVIDSALGRIVGFEFSENRGRVLENVAFVEMKRRGKDIYYHSNRNECDFIVKEGPKIKEAIQICHSLNETNREREISGLMGALEEFGLKEGLIITYEQEDEMVQKGKRIKVMPAWKWMLGK